MPVPFWTVTQTDRQTDKKLNRFTDRLTTDERESIVIRRGGEKGKRENMNWA